MPYIWRMLQEQITQYTAEINAFDTTNADELEQFRIRFLGTKGIIKDIFDEFKAVSPEEKRTLGKVLNEFKQLAEAKLPYISLCTDPTTGGTTASYAMLGDINISEPGALIGFAGPRVVRDTTGKDLPEGFQTAEFLLEHGFLDFITPRKELKDNINLYIDLIQNNDIR